MLYKQIFERLLNESKLDSLSNEVSRNIMFGIKERMDQVNSIRPKIEGKFITRTLNFDDFIVDDQTEKEFDLKTTIKVYATREDKTPVEAAWDWATNTLEVQVNVQSSTGTIRTDHLSMIQSRLYDSIRHELEHSTQDKKLAASSIKAHSSWAQDPKNIIKRKKYYTNKAEIPAFVSGIYNKAKKLRIPFYEAMEDDLGKIRKAMLRDPSASIENVEQQINDIRSAWKNYAKQRFPKAVIE